MEQCCPGISPSHADRHRCPSTLMKMHPVPCHETCGCYSGTARRWSSLNRPPWLIAPDRTSRSSLIRGFCYAIATREPSPYLAFLPGLRRAEPGGQQPLSSRAPPDARRAGQVMSGEVVFRAFGVALVAGMVALAARNLYCARQMEPGRPGRQTLVLGAVWTLVMAALFLALIVFAFHR